MTDKKYLKWYNKVGYGSGDIAGNVVYALLSSFVMIYLPTGRTECGNCRHAYCSFKNFRRNKRHILWRAHRQNQNKNG